MLKGKNVIVTGVRRGIGRAVLEAVAMNGGNVWACIRKDDDEFNRTIDELAEQYGVWIKPVCFDLNSEDEITRGIQSIIKEKKPIDILVNNAGISYGGLFTMTSLSTLREVFQINYFSQIQVMQLVLRVLQEVACIEKQVQKK